MTSEGGPIKEFHCVELSVNRIWHLIKACQWDCIFII